MEIKSFDTFFFIKLLLWKSSAKLLGLYKAHNSNGVKKKFLCTVVLAQLFPDLNRV